MPLSLGAGEEAQGDKRAGKMQEAEDGRRVAVVAQREAAERHDPGETALDYPPEPTEPFARFQTLAGDAWGDAARSERPPLGWVVIPLVRVQLRRPLAVSCRCEG